jgi:hypothetical protein
MKAIRVMWVDGQTRDGNGTAPAKLALRKDTDGMYRWYCQGYNEDGMPAGACTVDAGVSAATLSEAIEAAWMSWGWSTSIWNLRTTRTA